MDRPAVVTAETKTASSWASAAEGADDGLRHLHDALERARREEQTGRRRPAVVMAALCLLTLAAGSGVAFAVLLFLRPARGRGASLARNLVLAASAMSLVYIGFHVRGARSNRLRPPGPPHFYGEYTLAGALMLSRLAIGVWVAALVATVMLVAASPSPFAVAGATPPPSPIHVFLPLLHLVVCAVAIPSFFVVAAAIETRQAPFATAGLSPARPPLRTYRGDGPAEDLDEHVSISRRVSMQRAAAARESTESLEKPPAANTGRARSQSQPGPRLRHLQLVTADAGSDDDAKTELMANSPVRAAYPARPRTSRTAPPAPLASSVPPVPPLPPLSKIRSLPQLRNTAGTWRGARGSERSAGTSATGMPTSSHAASSRGSSPGTAPPFSDARRRGPATSGTSIVSATQPSRHPAARHAQKPNRVGRSRSSSLTSAHPSSAARRYTAIPASGIAYAVNTAQPPRPAKMLYVENYSRPSAQRLPVARGFEGGTPRHPSRALPSRHYAPPFAPGS